MEDKRCPCIEFMGDGILDKIDSIFYYINNL